MKELKLSFKRKGIPYTQLKRNDAVALYAVGGTYSDRTNYYEVYKIIIRQPDKKYANHVRESLPNDELFGRDLSRCFIKYDLALNYFDELTTRLSLSRRVPKVVSGVVEDNRMAA